MMIEEIKLLGHGYIKVIETWGSDARIVEAARMSTGKGFRGWGPSVACAHCGLEGVMTGTGTPEDPAPHPYRTPEQSACKHTFETRHGDEKLLRYLYENRHDTPFEMAGMIVEVRAPIIVFREWHRHRVPWSYNEASARYSPLPALDYLPEVSRLMRNASSASKQRGTVSYCYELLRGSDNYGSGDLAVCAREVKMRLSELETQVTELQTHASKLENERRSWKFRAEALRKLLDASLVDLRVGFQEALSHALEGEEPTELVSSFQTALERVAAVAERNWNLERDAWCGAAGLAREFLHACSLPMGDYAPAVVYPGEGKKPESAFIRRWRERFEAALSAP